MYLKEIKIAGFKSFRDNVTMTFDKGIACLVGPNGSGKSNIIDAVRFVLGEQSSKSLRGDQGMTDLIFSGSQNSKALNVASVSLTFDNSDNYLKIPFKEISIKRRIYRTGENDYFINGEKVRLKDIIDLFLDSGIGKNAFSIVGQGEIAKILSNSSLDRRSIIEQAAGIAKYKERKIETTRKLIKVDDNLNRVKDILDELKLQLDPLKEQSINARKYTDLKEELENLEISLITENIYKDNNLLKEEEKELEKENDKKLILEKEDEETFLNIEKHKKSIREKEIIIDDYNEKIVKLSDIVNKLSLKKEMLLKDEKYNLSEDKLSLELVNLKEEILKETKNKEILLKEIEFSKEEKIKEEKHLTSLYEKLESLENKITSINKETSELLRNIDYSNSRLNYLENFIDNKNSYNKALSSILNNPRLTGIEKTVEEVITCDEKYEIIKEISVGPIRNNLIVKDENSAKQAVEYLKNNKIGRLTFYPLTSIKKREIYDIEHLKSNKAYLGVLSDILEVDIKYKNIISSLFGTTLVAKTIDDAFLISNLVNKKYKVISLDGSVVNPYGSLTGGFSKINDNLVSSKREISELKEKIKINAKLKDELDLDNQKNINQRDLVNKEIFDLTSKINFLKQNIENKENLLEEKIKLIENLEFNTKVLDKSKNNQALDEISNDFYEKEKELNLLNLEKEKEVKEIKKIRESLEVLESTKRSIELEINKVNLYIKNLELAINTKNIKIDNNLKLLGEEYSLTYENARNKYILEIEEKEAEEKISKIKEEIKSLGFVNLLAIEEYKKVNERYTFLTSQETELLNAKDTLNQMINEIDSYVETEFKKTFNEVNIHFKEIFKKFFRGGDAELILTDPDNLLETGIEINATPPGKKLSSISLLSGGEKTLTAISLIFAILEIKDTPFCIFDEVEAALDEDNVLKFGEYIKEYSAKTDFLIVTHKKETMEYAKSLYGITMEEEGISKVVSIQLVKGE